MDRDTVAKHGLVSAGVAPAAGWGMAGLFATCMLLATAESPRAQDPSEVDAEPLRPKAAEKSAHDYTVYVRAAAWITWVDGEVKDTGGRSDHVDTIDIGSDLGFSDPTAQFVGTGNARFGRHDFWVEGFSYDESEDENVGFDLDFGDIDLGVNRRVITDLEFTDVNFRYGYSPFTFEEDGFRLGPTIAVSYTSVFIELTDKATGVKEEIDETYPAPTLGAHGELPIGDVMLEADLAGVYIEAGSFDGWAVRAGAIAVWRPWDTVGLFGGFKLIHADISLNREDIEATLYGPVVGLELRF